MRIVKLAQQGYDVNTAGDENLIYSSKWPLLKIYKQGSFVISSVTQTFVIAEHDLGFAPMFWFFANTDVSSWAGLTISRDTRSEFFGPIGDGALAIDSTKLTYTASSFPFTSGPSEIYYYIFAIDLTKQFDAPIINVGGLQSGRRGRVFKIAKEGKDISSDNLEDFVIHSDARSPLIHSVNPGVVRGGRFAVYHNLGYNPMFFIYSKSGTGYTMLATSSGGSTSTSVDKEKIEFSESSDGRELTIVVLKDPFNIEYTRKVQV